MVTDQDRDGVVRPEDVREEAFPELEITAHCIAYTAAAVKAEREECAQIVDLAGVAFGDNTRIKAFTNSISAHIRARST